MQRFQGCRQHGGDPLDRQVSHAHVLRCCGKAVMFLPGLTEQADDSRAIDGEQHPFGQPLVRLLRAFAQPLEAPGRPGLYKADQQRSRAHDKR